MNPEVNSDADEARRNSSLNMACTIVKGLGIAVANCSVLALCAQAPAQGQSLIEAGEQLYEQHCAECHGEKLRSSGTIPDLRELSANDRDRFDMAVKEGKGQMPSWEGTLSAENLDQLWAYIRAHAR